MNNIEAIIFDMDGVLVDSEPINMQIIDSIYDKVGIEVPDDIRVKTYGATAQEWWKFIKDEFNVKDYSAEEMALMEINAERNYFSDSKTEKTYFKGIEELLSALKEKGFKLAVASSNRKDIIENILDQGNILKYFDSIISGQIPEIENGKPAPDIFLYTAEDLNVFPKNCIVVEDSENGLQAAKSAGMTSIAFLSQPIQISLENADYTLKDYSDFFETIEI